MGEYVCLLHRITVAQRPSQSRKQTTDWNLSKNLVPDIISFNAGGVTSSKPPDEVLVEEKQMRNKETTVDTIYADAGAKEPSPADNNPVKERKGQDNIFDLFAGLIPTAQESDCGNTAVQESGSGNTAVQESGTGNTAARESGTDNTAARESGNGNTVMEMSGTGKSAAQESESTSNTAAQESGNGNTAEQESESGNCSDESDEWDCILDRFSRSFREGLGDLQEDDDYGEMVFDNTEYIADENGDTNLINNLKSKDEASLEDDEMEVVVIDADKNLCENDNVMKSNSHKFDECEPVLEHR